MITSLVNTLKLGRLQIQESMNETPFNDDIIKEVISMLSLPLLTNEMSFAIDEYLQVDIED